MAKSKKNVYQIVTDRILEMLDDGVVPWQKTWWTATPRNIYGRAYRGINIFLLSYTGFSSPYWLTYKQAVKLGGQVKKGEESQMIVFWKQIVVKDTDAVGKEIRKVIPLLRYFRVFNVEQCDGIDEPKGKHEKLDFSPIEAAENLVDGFTNCPIIEHGGNRASYNSRTDLVRMPNKKQFESVEAYYATIFHELIHSTGHQSRLGRKGFDNIELFKPESYSKEELIAELGAAFLGQQCGIQDVTIDNSAAYIAAWSKRLKSDPKFVVQAAGKAQNAVDHILGISWDNDDKDNTDDATANKSKVGQIA